jgi:tRNA 2-thiouridine synthesizing protein E
MIPQTDVTRPAHATVSTVSFDIDGFLTESDCWTADLAEQVARQAGIDELTAKHWEVIRIVREGYFSFGALPVMRLVCRAAGLDRSRAHEFFSSCNALWRIAGLPNPGEEAKSYMQ